MSTAASLAPVATPPGPSPTITAEQFGARPDPGHPEELVRGRIVPMSLPGRRYGQICTQVILLLGRFLEGHDLGHVLSNAAGVLTGRNPDTIRGADVAFYSFARLPKGDLPAAPVYGPEVPELVVEVLSPGDRWADVLAKVGEYLAVGVTAILVFDDPHRSAQVFRADSPPTILGPADVVAFPDLLPGFATPGGAFFG